MASVRVFYSLGRAVRRKAPHTARWLVIHPASATPLFIRSLAFLSTSSDQTKGAKGSKTTLQVVKGVLGILGADRQADSTLVGALVLEFL